MEHLSKTPQLEKGHTRIANELLLKLAGAGTKSGTQAGIMLLVMRFSYGYQRKQAFLTISEIAAHLGMNRTNVRKTIKRLLARQMLLVTPRPGHHRKAYQVQKDWRLWDTKGVGQKTPMGQKTPRVQSDPLPGTKHTHLAGTKHTPIKERKKIIKKGNGYTWE